MSADITAAARGYAGFFETLSRESCAGFTALAIADIRFKDPFNDLRGRDKVVRLFRQMFEDVEAPRFVVTRIAVDGDMAFLRWSFHFRRKGRPWTIEGVSEVAFDSDGMVVAHVDHWDAAEQVYGRIPLLAGLLQWLKRRVALREV